MAGEEDAQKLVSLEQAIKESQKKLSSLEGASFDIKIYVEDKIKDVEHKIDSSKTGVIEALGIFVALFSFIAVNVQIFTKITDLASAMWFMLVMSGITITILLTINVLLDSHKNYYSNSGKLGCLESLKNILISKLFILYVLAIMQIAAGIFFTYRTHIQLNESKTEVTKAN